MFSSSEVLGEHTQALTTAAGPARGLGSPARCVRRPQRQGEPPAVCSDAALALAGPSALALDATRASAPLRLGTVAAVVPLCGRDYSPLPSPLGHRPGAVLGSRESRGKSDVERARKVS